jgi:nucleotide-binding universal stress UspA family protein
MGTSHELKDKHILVAVDDTENGKRAVLYVADILGGLPGFRATVLHIVPEPPEDYFASEEEARVWRKEHESVGRDMVEKYREILHQSGFEEGKVSVMVETRYCPSVAECIFDKVKELDACTVVVGRRGITTKEEFILGSTSSRLLHVARNCAVWVVE